MFWDRSLVHAVEKAIINSNLGLSPATEGQMLRLRIPELNEERRNVNATLDARDPQWWGEATSTASDSKPFASWDSNLMTEFHARYGTGVRTGSRSLPTAA